jgi:release factor glutamine methyltransferase
LGYVLGQVGFWREIYEVTADTLIPRPDTEELVAAALERLRPGGRLLDLCTGSGCVAISILASCRGATGEAWEWNPGALAVARRNAARNGVEDRLALALRDVLDAKSYDGAEPVDLLVSNPPYLDASEMAELTPEVAQEPRMALDGGEDGLAFYRAILTHGRKLLRAGGTVLFEIGWRQGPGIRALAAELGYTCTVLPDIEGRDRVAVLEPL